MSYRADPSFLSQLREYGAVNIESCFNCGNCTAVCPLSSDEDNFPRRMIRYGQLGMKDKLLGSKELWLCYSCGECTATCPRQADPGEFMAAARRFAIAGYDRLRLASLMYTSPLFNVLFLLLLAAVLGTFIYSFHGPMPTQSLRLFDFIPSEVIHDVGVIAGLVVIMIAVGGSISMISSIRKSIAIPEDLRVDHKSAVIETIKEVFMQERYRQDCESYSRTQRWYSQKWFLHASMLWGFMGLFLATAMDFLLALMGIKPTGTWVPIWYPVRLLGTLAGLMLVYGVTGIIIKRLLKGDDSYRHSTVSDWSFLALLWLSAVTGFALEIAVYLPEPHVWSYWMLIAHLVAVGELLILLPFTKFAHIIYRTIALYVQALRPVPETEPVVAEVKE
ncbi:MAG TPA: 4Fe-4S dicluster domain-containing protein [Candidatus Acidoferrales bacterium]|nr:4Fe-4S dicluster domain-containing protein [Candidatus Acidoferrales bacterium]